MKSIAILILLSFCMVHIVSAQSGSISGKVIIDGHPMKNAHVTLKPGDQLEITDAEGLYRFKKLSDGEYSITASFVGFSRETRKARIVNGKNVELNFELQPAGNLDEVVVSGTMKEVKRLESPVPVEVYSKEFFDKNRTPTFFEALQNVNGVKPQINCNVCNTGDIHINGLEGPYTMILIDGMPIVSGLSTVYGLSGIPRDIIERVEIVKGPASSLYGSEAVGGLINIITKDPNNAPRASVDVSATSWRELSADISLNTSVGKKADVLTGLSYFNYNHPVDNNDDNFTDITLQDRVSVFQKWNFQRKSDKLLSVAGRYLHEDRWGGEMDWTPEYRGSGEIYGESILTNRWELITRYELPVKEKIDFYFSANGHEQESYYGTDIYLADQRIIFGQLVWSKEAGKHDLLLGSALRHNYYDDNTTATATDDFAGNEPLNVQLPGIFAQDEIEFNKQHGILLGIRLDYHPEHREIWTPRVAYKWTINPKNVLRLNAGTGFRVVNLFTEEHAALTGAREVEVIDELDPEQSYNLNLNFVKKIYGQGSSYFGIDLSTWYTHFTNQILPDYDTDPNKIIYDNLDGYAVSKGVSANFDATFSNGLKLRVGATAMEVHFTDRTVEGNLEKTRPILTENWSGTWSASYPFYALNLTVNYTGNLYGPMRLPLLSETDQRDEFSPWWSIQNIQFTWKKPNGPLEIYAAVKNLLNFTPPSNSIARAHDPFDEQVEFNEQGEVMSTASNPYALTFDPTYVYAPNQGIRFLLGAKYTFH